MNFEAYVPAITAALTLINTVILVWNQRQHASLRRRVNGMYLQTLADAEQRGRRSAAHQLGADPAEVDATSARPRNDPPR